MLRVCVSRTWKRARAQRAGRGIRPVGARISVPLFQGTVHLANLQFTGPGGPRSISGGDLATVAEYLGHVVTPIEKYASQYGTASLSAGTVLPPFAAAVTGDSYTDVQLQGWINQMALANGLGAGSAILVLNPVGVVNQDAKESGGVGVLGYHGLAGVPYSFVNALGAGFTLDDRADLFAEAVSHEIAEMTVDPRADDSNPEVCDGCGTNCLGLSGFRSFFDAAGNYLGSASSFPPSFPFGFFLSAIAQPAAAADCPAPASACAYPPP